MAANGGEGRKLKVLHVLHSIERSGAEVMLVQAAPLFEGWGLDLHALATGESVGMYAEQMAAAGFTIHHLPLESRFAHLLRFYRLLAREQFDVVHVHTEKAFFWYALAGRLAGVGRIVRTVHSVFDFSGFLWAERLVQRRIASRFLGELAVSPSASVQEAEHRLYGIHTFLIPNWTDSRRFSPSGNDEGRAATRAQFGIAEGSVVYISVGSCESVKNHAVIIRALASIAHACPDARYLHVGSGGLQAFEQQLVAELGLVGRVIFAGQRDDIPDLLRSSDAFVMPSTREGFGISCLEAMSCGLPVIASDVSGLRELVVDCETGFLTRSESDLACAMAELYRSSRLRERCGSAGRARALAEFNVQTSVESYVRLYRTS